MKNKNIRNGAAFSRSKKTFAILVVFLLTTTYALVAATACGPHEETPRSVVINEIQAGSDAWVEFVNPTSKDINVFKWKIQMVKDGVWKTIHTIKSDYIGKWGSGNEYLVVTLGKALPADDLSIRIIDNQGKEIDKTVYSSLDGGCTWARYKQKTGIPVDTDSEEDWYMSSNITKGYENDSVKS